MSRRIRHIAILTGFLPVILGAGAGNWRRVADENAGFAVVLANERVRFGSDFLKWVTAKVNENCRAVDSTNGGLDASQTRQVAAYRDRYCKPWLDAWEKALAPCDRNRPPAWCDDEDAMPKRVNLEPYFSGLAIALADASDSLARYNIMAVAVSATAPHLISEFPRASVDEWVARPASEFLKTGSPTEALEIAHDLSGTWVGLGPALARELSLYAERSNDLTDDQRTELRRLITKPRGSVEKTER